MGNLRKLASHSSHYLIGRAVITVLGFVSFPVFTRVFTVEQYGMINLILNIVMMFFTVAKCGLQTSIQRFYHDHARSEDPESLKRYYSSVFFGSMAIAVATALLCAGMAQVAPGRIIGGPVRGALALASLLVVIRCAYSMVLNLMQSEGRTIAINVYDILVKGLSVAAICAFIFFWERSVRAFVIGTVLVEGALMLAVLPWLVKRRLLSFSAIESRFIKTSLAFGFPLMIAEVGAVLLDSGDRLLVQYFLGPVALGYYAAAYGISSYSRELQIPLNLALFPICMDIWAKSGPNETREFLSKSLRIYLMLTVGLLCAISLLSRDIVVILASQKYQAAQHLIPVLVAGIIIGTLNVFFRAGLMIHNKTRVIAKITIWAIVVNTVLNVILLPWIGLMGAAIATLAAYAFQIVWAGIISTRLLSFQIDYKALAGYLGCAAVVMFVGFQIHMANPWAEACVRGGVSLMYPMLIWMLDSQSRYAVQQAAKFGQ